MYVGENMIGLYKGKFFITRAAKSCSKINGIGYEVFCSASAAQNLLSAGQGEVYTYTAVREDGIYLYGFVSAEEKKMFLKLITVSGVGPKMGITVLSGMNLSALALAIATSDVKTLSKIKGLGKKTAERIILELREKIGETDAEELPAGATEPEGEVDEDAVIALMSLGFNRGESLAWA